MKQRGFSIIELAVTMVIFGLLLASAMPNVTSWMRNAKLRSQAEAMQSGLQRARDEAVRRNRQVSFWLINQPSGLSLDDNCRVASTGGSWIVSAANPDNACSTATVVPSTATPEASPYHLANDGGTGVSVSGFTDTAAGTAAESVTFDGFGRVVNNASATNNLRRIFIAYGTAAAGDRPQRIDINTSGLIRSCDTSVTSTSDPRFCPASE